MTIDVIFLIGKMQKTDFDNKNLMNAEQNDKLLWETMLNVPEEDKELACYRTEDAFEINNSIKILCNMWCMHAIGLTKLTARLLQ